MNTTKNKNNQKSIQQIKGVISRKQQQIKRVIYDTLITFLNVLYSICIQSKFGWYVILFYLRIKNTKTKIK